MKKTITSFSPRAAMILLATMLLTLTAQTAQAWDGSGTEADPYLIKTTGDLSDLSTQSQTDDFDGVYFQLYNDITFDNTQSNNFVPIASGSNYFQGIFDGNGKTISGVRISTTETYQGLFASIGANGVVKNLKVTDTEISAWNMSGIIASYSEGTIEDCTISSDVILNAINPNGTQYGSIAGLVRDGTVSHCVSEASITLSEANGAYNSMGGLVGDLSGGTIEHCVFAGTMQISSFSMNTNNFAVVGKNTNGTIRNNYYTSSSLTSGYSNVTFAYTVTVPSQFVVSGEQGHKNSYYNGLFFNQKYYTPSGTTFYVFPANGWGTSSFDVQKTSTGSTDATNVASNYTMPAYDITLVFRGNMPPYDDTLYCYLVEDEDSWNMVADCVAAGVDFSGKTIRMIYDVTVSRPIGDSSHPFKGTFNGVDTYGRTRTITFTATATGDYCAPFANINGATIQGVNIAGTISTNYKYASGLVGKTSGVTSTIENVVSTVSINSTYNGAGYHGGLIGESDNVNMTNCVFAGSMQGSNTSNWSGLVGIIKFNTALNKCLFAPTSVIVNTSGCWQMGYKDSNSELVDMSSFFTLTDCYYATTLGTAQGTLAYIATLSEAIIPTNSSAGVHYNSKLYIGSGQTATLQYLASAGDEGVTINAMTAKDASNNNVAVTDNGDNTYNITMPAKNITVSGVMTDLWGLAGGADGSEDHPYLITTPAGLDLLAAKVNGSSGYSSYEGKYFKLGSDITYTYSDGDTWNSENSTTSNYTPIGNSSYSFCGHFDGDNHTIRGIRIYTADYRVGLFGQLKTNDAEIKNVILDDARITSTSYQVGGILGYTSDNSAQSKVTNCHVKNVLVKGTEYVGGVVGYNNKGTVSGCTSGATVTGSSGFIGGIVGDNSGTLKNCFYYGSGVTAGDDNKSSAGAITVNDGGTLQNNYYLPCPVTMKKDSYTTYTTNNGVGKPYSYQQNGLQRVYTRYSPQDVSANDGGLPVYAVTLGTVSNGTIAVATANVTHNSTDYFKAGATVTVTATPDDGYSVGSVTYNDGSDNDITASGTFTMPSKAVTVSSAFSENAFSLAYDSNNDAVLTTWNGQTAKVTLAGRTLKKDGSWNTLCLPFDVTIASSPLAGDGVTAKVFSSSSNLTNGALRLDFINAPATIHAGTPFIVKWTSGDAISNPVFTGVEVNSTAPVAAVSADGNVTFAGSFSPFDPTTGLWFDANNPDNGACHVALSTTEPVREGYTLTSGWNTAPDGSGDDVTTIPFDVVVYANGIENAPASIALTIGASGWATYYHDYTASYTAGSGTEVYYVSGVSPTTVTLTTTNGTVPATLPVLIYHANGGEVTLTKVDGSDGTIPDGITANTQFHGTATALASIPGFTAGSTYALYGGKFLLVDTDAGIAAHKCWLTLTGSAARQLSIVIDGGTTGIEELKNGRIEELKSAGAWYSLDGRKLDKQPTKKGLYIYNGKKTVIK